MDIRTAGPTDQDGLLALVTAFYAEGGFDTPVAELRRNLDTLRRLDTARVALADDAGALLGFAVTSTTFDLEQGRLAELSDLYVRPDRRRRGVGRALITDSLDWAAARGCRVVELVVAPSGGSLDSLVDYYARFGFRDSGRRLLTRRL